MRTRVAPWLAATAALMTMVADARADVAPPDSCSAVGQPCNNAGPSYNAAGVCVQSSCSHPSPDGGSSSYPCSLCEAIDGGSSSGSSSGGTDGGGSSSGGGSSKSGCATSPMTRDGMTGFAMLLVGVAALAWGRRRRS